MNIHSDRYIFPCGIQLPVNWIKRIYKDKGRQRWTHISLYIEFVLNILYIVLIIFAKRENKLSLEIFFLCREYWILHCLIDNFIHN